MCIIKSLISISSHPNNRTIISEENAQSIQGVLLGKAEVGPVELGSTTGSDLDGKTSGDEYVVQRPSGRIDGRGILQGDLGLVVNVGEAVFLGGPVPSVGIARSAGTRSISHLSRPHSPDKGIPLELDGYCEEIDPPLAFEVQGIHHYVEDEYYNVVVGTDFETRKKYDERKRRVCRERGIHLVEVPYNQWHRKLDFIAEQIVLLRYFSEEEMKKKILAFSREFRFPDQSGRKIKQFDDFLN